MAEDARGLTPETYVESAEGSVLMAETPNKGFAVLTRLPSGALGFRQLIRVTTVGPVPLVRVVLESGHAITVAAGHPFYRLGMKPVPAAVLVPGEQLEAAFRYPDGYGPPDLPDFTPRAGITVVAVLPAGEGPVMTGTVRETHALFLAAGILCGE